MERLRVADRRGEETIEFRLVIYAARAAFALEARRLCLKLAGSAYVLDLPAAGRELIAQADEWLIRAAVERERIRATS